MRRRTKAELEGAARKLREAGVRRELRRRRPRALAPTVIAVRSALREFERF